jgi:hypothetical protein
VVETEAITGAVGAICITVLTTARGTRDVNSPGDGHTAILYDSVSTAMQSSHRLSGRQLLVVCLVVSVVLAGVPAPASADRVAGKPNLSVFLPNNELAPGETSTLDVFVRNAGDLSDAGDPGYEALVQTARATTLRVRSGDAPLTVRTGKTPVGTLPDGVHGPVPFRVTVDRDAEPGTYRIPVDVAFEYTAEVRNAETGDPILVQRRQSDTKRLTVEIVEQARFRVVESETDAAVGESGTVRVTLENVGSDPADDATVTLAGSDPDLRLGDSDSANTFVGDWPAGERRTVTARVTVAGDAVVRNYSLDALVTYRDTAGDRQAAETLRVGVRPDAAQSFAVESVESTLRVDAEGEVRGTLRNVGDRPAEAVRVTLPTPESGLVFQTTTYPVGDLGPGEAATFAFGVLVANSTTAGPRSLELGVSYRDALGDRRTTGDEHTAEVEVGPRRDTFGVSPVDATFAVDSEGVLTVEVTNTDDAPVSRVTARIVPTGPVESDDPATVVGDLAPGETATLRFHLSVTNDAIPKATPVPLTLTYRTASGTPRIEETTIPVAVVAQEGSGLPILPIALVVVVLAGAGAWWWRRR